jgi:hypothetical protein
MKPILMAGLVIALGSVGLAPPAVAGPPDGGCIATLMSAKCFVTTPPTSGTGTGAGSKTGGVQVCSLGGRQIPCTDPDYGYWSASRGCYVGHPAAQPPKSDPAWGGKTTGAIYTCYVPQSSGGSPGLSWFWSAAAPSVAPDPAVLAASAVSMMRLRAPSMGMAPPPASAAHPDSMGIVGLPVWLWVVSPDASSWGPISTTASAGGYSVTATGSVDRIVWDMGDGGTVECTSPGVPWTEPDGLTSSPYCGYRYTKQSEAYTVTATAYWTITWSGIGRTGVIHQALTSSVQLTVGELQTVVVHR